MKKNINIAVIGASGYTGAELLRLLVNHPYTNITTLVANSNAGKDYHDLYPSFTGLGLPPLIDLASLDYSNLDAVFCCLPHAASQQIIKEIPDHIKVIDLSADFRLADVALYEEWYGPHHAPSLQPKAVYGLTEWQRDKVKNARLVACPGCYPTSALLPLWPLVQQQTLNVSHGIIIDAKTGVTGGGRSAKVNLLAAEVQEGIAAYGLAGKGHRHRPEIAQGLNMADGANSYIDKITFTPHLVPMNRGILATIYAKLAAGLTLVTAKKALTDAYADAPFVTVLTGETLPTTRAVRGSNNCHLNIVAGPQAGQVILLSAIDNLTKGSSGQAIQNLNVMQGWPEETGLRLVGLMP